MKLFKEIDQRRDRRSSNALGRPATAFPLPFLPPRRTGVVLPPPHATMNVPHHRSRSPSPHHTETMGRWDVVQIRDFGAAEFRGKNFCEMCHEPTTKVERKVARPCGGITELYRHFWHPEICNGAMVPAVLRRTGLREELRQIVCLIVKVTKPISCKVPRKI